MHPPQQVHYVQHCELMPQVEVGVQQAMEPHFRLQFLRCEDPLLVGGPKERRHWQVLLPIFSPSQRPPRQLLVPWKRRQVPR
jgi:hypothetical protein